MSQTTSTRRWLGYARVFCASFFGDKQDWRIIGLFAALALTAMFMRAVINGN